MCLGTKAFKQQQCYGITAELTVQTLGSKDILDFLLPNGLAVMAEERRHEPSDLLYPRGRLVEPDNDPVCIKFL